MQTVDKYNLLHVKHIKIGVKICQEYMYVLNLLTINYLFFGRPDPVYPTPQVDKTAAKCRRDVCLLPDCYCGGKDIPGKVPTSCVIPSYACIKNLFFSNSKLTVTNAMIN